ncbi:unnamed protein product [Rhizoctonia solani]|uniref:DRBM domain-containing protein n=1 Tax=Rhizoctonia solani TaxID=456999 RepID=A0A8H3BP39_9AGAM|nr:unnamed protein product [Rhizoctonia solani]
MTFTARLQEFSDKRHITLEWATSVDQTGGVDTHTVYPVLSGKAYQDHQASGSKIQEAKNKSAQLLIDSNLLCILLSPNYN